jgi:uncharacterized protein (TIGR03437 family)
VAAFGAFSGVATTTAASFPLPKTLGGVKVTVAGVDARFTTSVPLRSHS